MKKWLGIIGALFALAPSSVFAVVVGTPVYVQIPTLGLVQFLQGTDTAGTYKTLYTAGANGSRCSGIFASSTDTALAHLVTIQIVRAAIKYAGVAVNVPITSGFATGIPVVNVMAPANWPGLPTDASGNSYFNLVNGDTLQATFATALTASTAVNVVAICGDF